MRYRLDVVAASVADMVTFAGGWIFDRVMAGWDVTVLVARDEDVRPIHILGADTLDLETALAMWADRPQPHTLAVSADLFSRDSRIRRGVLAALEHVLAAVTDKPVEYGIAVRAAQEVYARARDAEAETVVTKN